jgi:hypothetical protein
MMQLVLLSGEIAEELQNELILLNRHYFRTVIIVVNEKTGLIKKKETHLID